LDPAPGWELDAAPDCEFEPTTAWELDPAPHRELDPAPECGACPAETPDPAVRIRVAVKLKTQKPKRDLCAAIAIFNPHGVVETGFSVPRTKSYHPPYRFGIAKSLIFFL